MIGGSLGIRTGSYGSLQQQQQLFNGATFSIQSTPASIRKQSKMLLSGAREKERLLPWICKVAGRRKVGMLLVLIAAVSVCLSFIFVVSKEEYASAKPGTNLSSTDHIRNFVNRDWASSITFRSPLNPVNGSMFNTASKPNRWSGYGDNETQPPVAVLPLGVHFTHHPCENFSFPPPPSDMKRTGPRPCPVCYAPVELAVALMPALPSVSPVLQNLSYVSNENVTLDDSNGGSIFGGHPSLQQRNESFDIKESMVVHCGFVRGKKPGQGSGFDIDEADLLEMEQCHGVVVASAIFGNYDVIQPPKDISEAAKTRVCFYMFVDEETEAYIKNSSILDSTRRVGLWRVVVVRNLPYVDSRRNGKVPKLLLQRLFPNVRYSVWIDGKLKLVVDPYQILERFLWRQNSSFAISRHYRRFDVFVEAEANKAAGKYDNSSIDDQIEFYRGEGLTHYSSAKLPITSDVPEGCVIIREHTPITNLFTCLWFNEVDRFTARDQLSFSTVRDRIMSRVNWTINMFMDCERRNFVVQEYHRDLLEERRSRASLRRPPPLLTIDRPPPPSTNQSRKVPFRRGRDRRSGARRHRPRVASGKD